MEEDDEDFNNGNVRVSRDVMEDRKLEDDLGILSLDSYEDLTLVEDGLPGDNREDNWLLPTERRDASNDDSWQSFFHTDEDLSPLARVKKKSLVNKLDELANRASSPVGNPFASSPNSSLSSGGGVNGLPSAGKVFSPAISSYLHRNRLASTPTGKRGGNFDSRTFTRKDRQAFAVAAATSPPLGGGSTGNADLDALSRFSAGKDLNATFGIDEPAVSPMDLNATFTRDNRLNSTFEVSSPPDRRSLLPPGGGAQQHLNATFSRKQSEDLSRGSSHDANMDDDRLSATSDCSLSHQLNDVGDVQHIARIQEESLRQQQPPTQYQQDRRLLSPEIESNPQYSSQDSLPDSPYSSQSLDSHPSQAQDRIGRSMPNLNKRGKTGQGNAGGRKGGPGGPPPRVPSAGPPMSGYGLSRHQYNTGSDPRLQQQQPPHRGYQSRPTPTPGVGRQLPEMPPTSNVGPPRYVQQSSSSSRGQTSGLRPPSTRIARPAGSGIPRPGSRLPVFSSSTSRGGASGRGIPKPTSNSRSNSATRRNNWMEDCY